VKKKKKKKAIHRTVRKPMPRKPPKVEIPETAYRRRPKHPKPLTQDETA
jgi:hypothetical protein